jgi:hypothetical protein
VNSIWLKIKKPNAIHWTLLLLVTQEGFEPPTSRSEVCHSIQLNY